MRAISSAIAAVLASTALFGADRALAVEETYATEQADINVTTFADGLSHPWGLAFLPDGRSLVTERAGNLRLVSEDGEVSEPLDGVPDVDARSQGGLLDVALDPEFSSNRMVYLSFSEPGEGGNSTAVARGVLNEDATALTDVEVIFSQKPKVRSAMHYGSRLVFDREGRLYVTLGDRAAEEFRGQAQELDSHIGKIVRIDKDGSAPEDNPFVGQPDALPEIWSYGHRNIQGAALHPETGALWINEHGPRGGDEINIPKAGGNYGWPLVSYGVNYSGSPVGTGQSSGPGLEEPIYQWTPVIAVSGMEFYTGEAFPQWRGDLFVGGLVATSVVRLELDGSGVTDEERLLTDLGLRIRAVRQGPQGDLFALTDEPDGEILRISPSGSAGQSQ